MRATQRFATFGALLVAVGAILLGAGSLATATNGVAAQAGCAPVDQQYGQCGVTCNGSMAGTIAGNLIVPADANCQFTGTINGNVIVKERGQFELVHSSTVGGDLLAGRSTRVGLAGSTVNGNVTSIGGLLLEIHFDMHIGGNVNAVLTPTHVTKSSSVDGNVNIVAATGVNLSLAIFGGNVTLIGNSDVGIGDVTISRNLICFANTSVTLGANIAVSGRSLGQCHA